MHRMRTPPQWLRVLLAGFLLAFALNTVAHVAHSHDTATASVTHAACGYCATFTAFADAPEHAPFQRAPLNGRTGDVQRDAAIVARIVTAAHPRAPPLF